MFNRHSSGSTALRTSTHSEFLVLGRRQHSSFDLLVSCFHDQDKHQAELQSCRTLSGSLAQHIFGSCFRANGYTSDKGNQENHLRRTSNVHQEQHERPKSASCSLEIHLVQRCIVSLMLLSANWAIAFFDKTNSREVWRGSSVVASNPINCLVVKCSATAAPNKIGSVGDLHSVLHSLKFFAYSFAPMFKSFSRCLKSQFAALS